MVWNKKTLEEVVLQMNEKWHGKYGYHLINKDNYIDTQHKVPIWCFRHKKIFWQSPNTHLGGCGCPDCGFETSGLKGRLDSNIAKQIVINVFGEKDYFFDKFKYETSSKKVIVTCKKHGDFKASYQNLLKGHGCPRCKAEAIKKTIFGVGINDYQDNVIGGDAGCAYKHWYGMLKRCYSNKVHEKQPCYIGCSVCNEWLVFSNFKKWFDENYKEGYQLDKDIIVKNNKIYSPSTCCFVPQEINHLLVKPKLNTKGTPIGVTRRNNAFRVLISKYGKRSTIGQFKNIKDAFWAYKNEKEKYIKEVAQKYYDENKITKRVYDALMRYEVEITD